METLGLPRFRRSPKLFRVTSLAQQPSRSLIAWVALVLLIGVGHVVPALHFLFVAHHLCAEHGELVDAVADASRAEHADGSREKARSSEAVCVSGAAAHSHEHCEEFAAARAAAALLPAPVRAQLLAALGGVGPAQQARDAHVDIALLRYAPKLAPPGATLA